jgi:hypothetical protein
VTTVRQYVQQLRPVGRRVGQAIGADVGIQEDEQRATLNLIMAMVCVLIKLLVDTGLITDAQLTTAYTTFLNTPADYPDVPPRPPYGSGPAE